MPHVRPLFPLLGLVLASVPASAQERSAAGSPVPGLAPGAAVVSRPVERPPTIEEAIGLPPKDFVAGCLILHDGRTFVGRITPIAGGYQTEQPRGRLIFPFDRVRLTATTLEEAYEKQREGMQNGNASERQELARWCLEQKLFTQARTECMTAIRMEPQRADLRQLLLKIDAAMNQVNAAANPALLPVAAPVNQARSAQGLTARTTADFIRQVQPLLMNSCANAACHGANSERELRFLFVAPGHGSQRYQSQHNLEQVMRQITLENPETSPLLAVPRDKRHSPVHTNVYIGRKGLDQYELLKAWVVRAAQEKSTADPSTIARKEAPIVPERSMVIEPRVHQAAAEEVPSERSAAVFPASGVRERVEPGSRFLDRSITDAQLMEEVKKASRPDPFDPREFNEAMGLVPPMTP